MDQSAKKRITSIAPELKDLEFDTIDSLVNEISKNNRLLWPTINALIYLNLKTHLNLEKNCQIEKGENIYDLKYFTPYPCYLESELSRKMDLTFPRRQMSKRQLIINLTLIGVWSAIVFWVLFANPEFLLFGLELILQNVLLIVMLPYLVLFFAAPKWMERREFNDIKNFEELTNYLYTLNLWRYRINDFKRLKDELNKLVKSP